MYSIAKLLDEPQKLESLIISILQILITAWIGTEIIGFEFSPSDISIDALTNSKDELAVFSEQEENGRISFDEIIYLVLTVIGLWYLIWTIIADLLLGGLIKFLARLGKSENTLKLVLSLVGAIETKGDRIVGPEKNITWFVDSINSEGSEQEFLDVDDTRLNHYFFVGLFGFLILLYSDKVHLNGWEITVACIVLPSVFMSSIIAQKCFNHLNESLPSVRQNYNPLSHVYKVRRSIELNKTLVDNYTIEINKKKIFLRKKVEYGDLPKEIVIIPAYFPNEKIALEVFGDLVKKEEENVNKAATLVVSNLLTDEQIEKYKSDKFEIVSGESEYEIHQAIELYLYQKRKVNYKVKQLLEDK